MLYGLKGHHSGTPEVTSTTSKTSHAEQRTKHRNAIILFSHLADRFLSKDVDLDIDIFWIRVEEGIGVRATVGRPRLGNNGESNPGPSGFGMQTP